MKELEKSSGNYDQVQDWCDQAHDWLMANDAEYAASVKTGQTTHWADPTCDVDENGEFVNDENDDQDKLKNTWYLIVKSRIADAFSK